MTKRRFEKKVAIVTGSSGGIGRATALELAKRGASVVLNGRRQDRLERVRDEMTAAGHNVIAVSGDVTSPDDCERIVENTIRAFGRIDVLINNAGIVTRGRFDETQPAVFEQTLTVNVLGSTYPTMAALPYLREAKGSVTFISSIAGLRGFPMAAPYSASKMALTALAESLKVELTGTGVHVGVVFVSFTENDPDKRVLAADGTMISVSPLFQATQSATARAIVRSIEKRRFRTVLTPLGKSAGVLQRVAPRLFDKLLALSSRKASRFFR